MIIIMLIMAMTTKAKVTPMMMMVMMMMTVMVKSGICCEIHPSVATPNFPMSHTANAII